MTPVYSGGLVYEYSQEESKYGLVVLDGSTVKPLDDFTNLVAAFKATPNPSGDGGYNSTAGASQCPAQSATWNVTSDALPAIPSDAAKLMQKGAGTGAGLTGKGSQTASGTSTSNGNSNSNSGSGTTGGSPQSSTSKAAASSLQPPFSAAPLVVTAITVAFAFLGATLL